MGKTFYSIDEAVYIPYNLMASHGMHLQNLIDLMSLITIHSLMHYKG